MSYRPLALTGVALLALTGCHSYFPHGHGASGPFNAFPPGTYGPPGGAVSPTYAPGRASTSGGAASGALPANPPAANGKIDPVPNYKDGPADLGTPADDDTISKPRSTSGRQKSSSRVADLIDDADDHIGAFGEEEFAPPVELQPASATDEADDFPRQTRKSTPSPYRYDKEAYTWLRGKVARDAQSRKWRLKYIDDTQDELDEFGGELILSGHSRVESLKEGDVIAVKGQLDPSAQDHTGRPIYRVQVLDWLKPKSE
ncbi:MAG: hypothetical protein ACKV0T_05230 [Planctomycetales bacterium]